MTKTTAHGLMLLAAFVWGTTFIAQTTGMETIGPMTFTAIRYLIGALTVLPLAIFEARRVSLWAQMKADRRFAFQTIGLGFLMFGGIGLQQTALRYTDVANAAFLTALYVPAVPLIMWLFMRNRIDSRIWIALVMSLAGSWFLSGNAEILQQWGDFSGGNRRAILGRSYHRNRDCNAQAECPVPDCRASIGNLCDIRGCADVCDRTA